MSKPPFRLVPSSPPAHAGLMCSWYRSAATWRVILLGYVPFTAVAHLAWELLQLPLYTIWRAGTPSEIAFAVLHCTAGDVLIALAALSLALVITRGGTFADWNLLTVGGATMALALAYTVVSERVNAGLGYWAYGDTMPVVPAIGVGLSPVAQWLLVPALTFAWLSWRRRVGRRPAHQESSC